MRQDGPGPRAPVETTVQNKRAVRAILEACGFRTGDEVRRAVTRLEVVEQGAGPLCGRRG